MDEKQVFGYGCRDAEGNGHVITDYSEQALKELADKGYTFTRAYVGGTYDVIDYTEVIPPKPPKPELLPIISYQMWQNVMNPLRALMASSMQPAVALLSVNSRSSVTNHYQEFIDALDEVDDFFKDHGF